MLDRTGYRVESVRRQNMFPKHLTGLPGAVRDLYSRFSSGIIAMDRALSRIPVLNRIAGFSKWWRERTAEALTLPADRARAAQGSLIWDRSSMRWFR